MRRFFKVRGARPPRKIIIDLSRPSHRNKLMLAFLGVIVIGMGFLLAGYAGYQYSESAKFCGTLCHVMSPQYARYERSPHLNVECAKCHIGPGASFFVRSKIDGIKQVYAVLAHVYQRPIKSPIHNLRPARETCETCHSPTTFKDNIVKTIYHFDNDAANTPVMVNLILKMGGWEETTGKSKGIHWHITSQVEYIAGDDQRQEILWVGLKQPDGQVEEYFRREMLTMPQADFVEQARKQGKVRKMDCIDCHNRTAHFIPSPEQAVDGAIEDGLISASIPYVRAKAIELLNTQFSNQADAFAAIDQLGKDLRSETASSGASIFLFAPTDMDIQSAVAEIKHLYTVTNFPEMNLTWKTNPNNANHSPFLGCLRCHDDNHVLVNQPGDEVTISARCNLCHTVPIVGRGRDLLVEAPVISGPSPASHNDMRWTVSHRNISESEQKDCLNCHGKAYCSNSACHNLSHPENMLYTHAQEYRLRGDAVCFNCHQNNIQCNQCHTEGILKNP